MSECQQDESMPCHLHTLRPRASPDDSDLDGELTSWASTSNEYPQQLANDFSSLFEQCWPSDVSWNQASGRNYDFWDPFSTFAQPQDEPRVYGHTSFDTSAESITALLAESRPGVGWQKSLSLPSGVGIANSNSRVTSSNSRGTSNTRSRARSSELSTSDTNYLTLDTKRYRRPGVPRRTKRSPVSVKTELVVSNSVATCSYPCLLSPYGCTGSFRNKNEWKRHADTIHLEFFAWMCDLCPASKQFTTNRKDLFKISYHVSRERTLITEKGSVDLRVGDFARIPVAVAHDNRGSDDVHLLFYIPAPVTECIPPTRTTEYTVQPLPGWEPGVITEIMTECLGAMGCDVCVSLTDEKMLSDTAKTDLVPITVLRPSRSSATEWLYKSELVWLGSTTLTVPLRVMRGFA